MCSRILWLPHGHAGSQRQARGGGTGCVGTGLVQGGRATTPPGMCLGTQEEPPHTHHEATNEQFQISQGQMVCVSLIWRAALRPPAARSEARLAALTAALARRVSCALLSACLWPWGQSGRARGWLRSFGVWGQPGCCRPLTWGVERLHRSCAGVMGHFVPTALTAAWTTLVSVTVSGRSTGRTERSVWGGAGDTRGAAVSLGRCLSPPHWAAPNLPSTLVHSVAPSAAIL